MRLGLFDLLIAAMMFLTLSSLAPDVAGPGVAPALTLLLFPVIYLAVGSYIYKRLNFRPLWLPKCPHCEKRIGYFQAEYVMNRATQICVVCGGTFELWFSRPPEEYEANTCPELLSVYPQLIGSYRILSTGAPSSEVRSVFPEVVGRVLLSPGELADPGGVANRLKKGSSAPELLSEIPDYLRPDKHFQLYGDADLILLETSLTTDRCTNGRNIWRTHELGRWMVKSHGRVRAYDPETGELEFVLK